MKGHLIVSEMKSWHIVSFRKRSFVLNIDLDYYKFGHNFASQRVTSYAGRAGAEVGKRSKTKESRFSLQMESQQRGGTRSIKAQGSWFDTCLSLVLLQIKLKEDFNFLFLKAGSTPNVGLKLTTPRSRVTCSTD